MEAKDFKASKAKFIYYYPFIFKSLRLIKNIKELKELNKSIKSQLETTDTPDKELEGIDFNLGEEYERQNHMRDYVSLTWPRFRFRWKPREFEGSIKICHYPKEIQQMRGKVKISSKLSLFWNGIGVVRIVLEVESEIDLERIIALANLGELYPRTAYKDSQNGDFISCQINEKSIVLFKEALDCINLTENFIKKLFRSNEPYWLDSCDLKDLSKLPYVWPEFITVDKLDNGNKLKDVVEKGWMRPFPLIGLKLEDIDKDNFEESLKGEYQIESKKSNFNEILVSILFRSLDISYASRSFITRFLTCGEKGNIVNMSANRKQFFHCGHKAAVFLCSSFETSPANYTFPTLESTIGLTLLEWYPLKFLIQHIDQSIFRISSVLTNSSQEEQGEKNWREKIFKIKAFSLILLQNYVRLRIGTGSLKELYEDFSRKLGIEELLDMVKFRISQLDSLLQWFIEIEASKVTKIDETIKTIENFFKKKMKGKINERH